MIKISVYINQNGQYIRYYADSNSRFAMRASDGSESILLSNAGNEYDGVCDENGRLHFLIQTLSGGLIYLKYDGKNWKKYSIFQNKDNLQKISHIRLTYSGESLCAFYIMDHGDRLMLIKHSFSSANLYTTPEVADLTDGRKDFCICSDNEGNTLLFYRDISGKHKEKIYDRFFFETKCPKPRDENDIYGFCAVNSGKQILTAYITVKKNYTALVFKPRGLKSSEKIITFGIPRNTPLTLSATEDIITVQWEENSMIMQCVSKNGGADFSKPTPLSKTSSFEKIRYQGLKAGIYYADSICNGRASKNLHSMTVTNQKRPFANYERSITMNSRQEYSPVNRDMTSAELMHKLSSIERHIEKIGIDLDKVCIFLDKLIQFKEETDKKSFVPQSGHTLSQNNDIGERNDENIKLFESMDIDSVLPQKKENDFVRNGDEIDE